MSSSLAQLIDQLADLESRQQARAELVALGGRAVPALLDSLQGEPTPDQRKTILRIMLEMKDQRTEELFRRSCRDNDEEIRVIGARGLFLLDAADRVEACLATINDAPDMLHFEMTPSVQSLISLGLPVLAAVHPLLNASDPHTRQRAQKVFEQVTRNELQRRIKAAPLSNKVQQAWEDLWGQNGNYRWDAALTEREMAAERWADWLEQQTGDDPGDN